MSRYHVGKLAERTIAKKFKTRRLWDKQFALSIISLEADWLAIGVCVRPQPKWLHQELKQAIDAAKGKNKLPILEWHHKGKSYGSDLIVMRARDFHENFGK